MAHYIISWLRNHKEFNDSAFFNMEVFKLFNAKDPQLRKYFYKNISFSLSCINIQINI